jgi:hypothetical protein
MFDDLRQKIKTAESWSVEYRGVAFDEARKVDGTWYYNNLVSGEYRIFFDQSKVLPLFKNRQRRLTAA